MHYAVYGDVDSTLKTPRASRQQQRCTRRGFTGRRANIGWPTVSKREYRNNMLYSFTEFNHFADTSGLKST